MKALLVAAIAVLTLTSTAACGEIPFTLEKGLIIVSGKAKDGQPIQAAIFTGSIFSFYSKDLQKRFKLQVRGSYELLGGGRQENSIPFVVMPDLTFADQSPVEVKMQARSFDAIEKLLGHKIDMIVGLDYLDGRIVQFDFKKHVLRFLDRPPFDYQSAAKSGANGDVRLAMRMDEHMRTLFGDPISMPITEEIELNGTPIRTLFDTGVAFPVSVGPFAAKKNSIGSAPSKEESAKVQLKSINLAGYEMTDVPALVKGSWDDTETRYAAIVGVGVMQNFTVTFDWRNKWIALER
jgi:hypothetical protein